MTQPQHLLLDFPAPHVARLSLNRPQAANALNTAMALEIIDFFAKIPARPEAIRAIIFTGAGKHFCAGADLKERAGLDEAAWMQQHAHFRAARAAIATCPLPVLAAVQGSAFGGGLELALACDFIYAVQHARFGLSEASLGIMPGMGGVLALPAAVGAARAKELLYTAQPFSAQQAQEWGLINRLCAPEGLMAEALATACAIAANAPLAVAAIKKTIAEARGLSPEEASAAELLHYNALLASADRIEGIAAWNEKRPPVFAGK
jgi:enoyl-CoA hydratase/carnithine racemase